MTDTARTDLDGLTSSADLADALRMRVRGFTADVSVRKWMPNLHPRGRDGKFIEVGGWVNFTKDGSQQRGKVKGIEKTGMVSVEKPDGSTESLRPGSLTQAEDVKATLDEPVDLSKLPPPPEGGLPKHGIIWNGETMSTGSGTKDDPIVTSDVEIAARALADDKYVQLNQVEEVSTLLDKLAQVSREFAAKGESAKGKFDLCKVTVPGTNVFCAQAKVPDRKRMPQLGGVPNPGSPADSLPRNKDNEVDLTDAFVEHLSSIGIGVTDGQKEASFLKASQGQLDGATVAGMMTNPDYDPGKNPIFITRDGYVVDGHHRWAAQSGRAYKEGEPLPMNVRVIDADIIQTLDIANKFAADMGMPQRGLGENGPPTSPADKVDAPSTSTRKAVFDEPKAVPDGEWEAPPDRAPAPPTPEEAARRAEVDAANQARGEAARKAEAARLAEADKTRIPDTLAVFQKELDDLNAGVGITADWPEENKDRLRRHLEDNLDRLNEAQIKAERQGGPAPTGPMNPPDDARYRSNEQTPEQIEAERRGPGETPVAPAPDRTTSNIDRVQARIEAGDPEILGLTPDEYDRRQALAARRRTWGRAMTPEELRARVRRAS